MKRDDVFVGMQLPELRIDPISRRTLALFAGASGDHQPTHLDIDAARAKGHQDVFAHGMLMMAYLSRTLTNWVRQEDVQSFKVRFVAYTPVNATPTCSGKVTAVDNGLATVELLVNLPDGKPVVRGEAVVVVA